MSGKHQAIQQCFIAIIAAIGFGPLQATPQGCAKETFTMLGFKEDFVYYEIKTWECGDTECMDSVEGGFDPTNPKHIDAAIGKKSPQASRIMRMNLSNGQETCVRINGKPEDLNVSSYDSLKPANIPLPPELAPVPAKTNSFKFTWIKLVYDWRIGANGELRVYLPDDPDLYVTHVQFIFDLGQKTHLLDWYEAPPGTSGSTVFVLDRESPGLRGYHWIDVVHSGRETNDRIFSRLAQMLEIHKRENPDMEDNPK